MELSEALRTIDATKGMFDFFLCEVKFGDLKEKFLQTPIEHYYDAKKWHHSDEHREYYTFLDNGIECKGYIVDIHPVCNYLINEWPSSKAKKIRRILYETFSFCFDACKDVLGEEIAPALEEGYAYDKRFMETPEPRTIKTVIFDTIHEMIHALGLTEYEESNEEQEYTIIEEKKDYVKEIDWVKVTNNFDPYVIKDVVNTGRNKRERRSIIKVIYDAMSHSGVMYKIPYSVDKLLVDLFKENNGNFNALLNPYDKSNETLYINDFIQYAIKEYMERHTATDADIDEIFAENSKSVESKDTEGEVPYVDNLSSTEKQIKTAVMIMRNEKVFKHLYDYAYLMKVMNETDDMPNFNSPKSFLDYITDLGITDLPSEDSIKKKVNATFDKHPSWTFTDTKGKDANEAKRRNAVGSRFLSICRKGK